MSAAGACTNLWPGCGALVLGKAISDGMLAIRLGEAPYKYIIYDPSGRCCLLNETATSFS